MRMYWEPDEGPAREWPVDFDAMPPEEYEAVEALGIWPSFDVFVDACSAANRSAWRVLLWVCIRRDDPTVALADVRPRAGQFAMRWDPPEELRIAETALEDPETTDEERDYFRSVLPELREAAQEWLGKHVATPGGTDPAPSPTSGGPDGGSSSTT